MGLTDIRASPSSPPTGHSHAPSPPKMHRTSAARPCHLLSHARPTDPSPSEAMDETALAAPGSIAAMCATTAVRAVVSTRRPYPLPWLLPRLHPPCQQKILAVERNFSQRCQYNSTENRHERTYYQYRGCPRNKTESRTEKVGPMASMVCVKETAIFPKLMLVKTLPIKCIKANGRILSYCINNLKSNSFIANLHYFTTSHES